MNYYIVTEMAGGKSECCPTLHSEELLLAPVVTQFAHVCVYLHDHCGYVKLLQLSQQFLPR